MRTRILTLIAFVTMVLVPSMVLAHPGHGTFDGLNLGHYLTSPVHLASLLVIVAATVFAVRYVRKRNRQTKE